MEYSFSYLGILIKASPSSKINIQELMSTVWITEFCNLSSVYQSNCLDWWGGLGEITTRWRWLENTFGNCINYRVSWEMQNLSMFFLLLENSVGKCISYRISQEVQNFSKVFLILKENLLPSSYAKGAFRLIVRSLF